jgi:thiamine biosynthesis lipoprotein
VVIPFFSKKSADHLFSIVELELSRIENKFSRFNPDSIIYNLNKSAYKKPVVVDEETYSLLLACQKFNQETMGYFDISLGWLQSQLKENKEVQESEIQSLISGSGMDRIELDPGDHSVYFKNSNINIDLGAVGKGYALEKIKQILLMEEINSAFISFGESSVLSVGTHPYGESWPVGIRNVYNDKEVIYTFHLKDQSLSTSGITCQNTLNKDTGDGHIINPKTGKPVHGIRTVSILSGSAVEAEVLSTAMIATEDINRFIHHDPSIQMVRVTYNPDKTYRIEMPLET